MTNETPRKIFYLYKITNLVNRKIYIGQTINPRARWYAHRNDAAKKKPPQIITRAIKKYGNHNFEFEVIACCTNQNDTNEIETLLVAQYDCYIKNNKGYNATLGGMNAPKSEEQKLLMKGKHTSPDTEFQKGHKHTPETLQKMSENHKGQISWNKGTVGIMKPNQTSFQSGHVSWLKDTNITTSSSFEAGSEHRMAKLNEQQVLEIVELNKQGIKKQDIADTFSIKIDTIYSIVRGRRWNHITGLPKIR